MALGGTLASLSAIRRCAGSIVGALLAAVLLATGIARAEQPLDHFMVYSVATSKGKECVNGPTPGFPCTSNSACGPGGSCANLAAIPTFGPVQLTDQFGTLDYRVGTVDRIGLPANKNAEGVTDPNTHLRGYKLVPFKRCVGGPTPGNACIKASQCGTGGHCQTPPTTPLRTVRIVDQCMNALIDVKQPHATYLLVPANEDPLNHVSPPDASQHVDHFLCYDAVLKRRTANGTALPAFPRNMQVDVADDFNTLRYHLTGIKRLCNPVAKQQDPSMPPVLFNGSLATTTPKTITPSVIENPTEHLVCYTAALTYSYIAQTACRPTTPGDVGTSIVPRPKASVPPKNVYVADQFGGTRLNPGKPIELCMPSAKSICGNGVAEFPEECDGTDTLSCNGTACRDDCTCTPTTCGNDVQEGSAEACDGTDNAACGGLPCRADCSCTPPSCGDNITNQPVEACDGTDDSACPGQCSAYCLCPGPQCLDPSRTIYAGPPGLGCFTFNGNQAACEAAYWAYDGTNLAQCLYYPNTQVCTVCDNDSQVAKDCTNTCNCGNSVLDPGEECDGSADAACPGQCLGECRCAPPPCTQDPTRVFVGWIANPDRCGDITDQTTCDHAFYSTSPGLLPTSCYFSGGSCRDCDEYSQAGGECTNSCTCGNNVVDAGEQCDGTSDSACPGQCTNCQCP